MLFEQGALDSLGMARRLLERAYEVYEELKDKQVVSPNHANVVLTLELIAEARECLGDAKAIIRTSGKEIKDV